MDHLGVAIPLGSLINLHVRASVAWMARICGHDKRVVLYENYHTI